MQILTTIGVRKLKLGQKFFFNWIFQYFNRNPRLWKFEETSFWGKTYLTSRYLIFYINFLQQFQKDVYENTAVGAEFEKQYEMQPKAEKDPEAQNKVQFENEVKIEVFPDDQEEDDQAPEVIDFKRETAKILSRTSIFPVTGNSLIILSIYNRLIDLNPNRAATYCQKIYWHRTVPKHRRRHWANCYGFD